MRGLRSSQPMGYPPQSLPPSGVGAYLSLFAARPHLLCALRQALGTQWPRAPMAQSLHAVTPEDLIQAVRRHRLALVLAPFAATLPWPPEAVAALRQEARREQRAALPLIADTLAVFAALEAGGLRALLFKGPSLALQTTGQAWTRGGGDIDVLVAAADLPRAVAVLESVGFERPAGQFPRDLGSF